MSRGKILPPVFIVGTGRCGSTLLSRCLSMHPDVLSLSELMVFATDLGGRIAQAFPQGAVSGADFWRILGTAHPRQTLMLRHDVLMDEALYRPGPDCRFDRDSGIPAIAATTLPALTDDPDALFDRVAAIATSLPPAPVGAQYTALFDRLRDEADARVWVERSGGSLRIVSRLREHFPDARFVHIVRDGRDAALSMSRHYGFRLALAAAQITEILGVDPYEHADRRWEADLPDALLPYLPERFDAETFRSDTTPLPLCGHYWSGEIRHGLDALRGLSSDRLLTLHYEDLLAEPQGVLERFFAFLLQGDAGCDLDTCAALVRPPHSRWRDLPESVADELERACRPGFEALAAHGAAMYEPADQARLAARLRSRERTESGPPGCLMQGSLRHT